MKREQPFSIKVFPRELPTTPLHTAPLPPIPSIQILDVVSFDFMEVFPTVEPVEIVSPTADDRVRAEDLLLQGFSEVSPDFALDLLSNSIHGF